MTNVYIISEYHFSLKNFKQRSFQNSSEIRYLAQRITPGKLNLVNIYADATNDPFSYLLIDMTQEGKPEVKYLSHLFEKDSIVNTFIPM